MPITHLLTRAPSGIVGMSATLTSPVGHRGGRQLGLLPVAQHDVVPAHGDLPARASRHLPPLFVDDPDLGQKVARPERRPTDPSP